MGGSIFPYEFTSLSTPDIGHSWGEVHSEWNSGAMNGFYTTDGINAMGYYTAAELPFYYSLLDEFTLCVNYFCSLLGPTWPNRFYFAAGTSGGITTNGLWGYGIFDYPIILDLLDAAGVTWKVYNNTGTVFLSGIQTMYSSSGSVMRMTSVRSERVGTTSTISSRGVCRRYHGSSPASPEAWMNTRQRTSRSEWVSKKT